MTLWQLIKAEIRSVLTNPVVTLTVFGGVVFYSFLYPLPYSQQTPREQPIAVVNLDGSQTSLKLERMSMRHLKSKSSRVYIQLRMQNKRF